MKHGSLAALVCLVLSVPANGDAPGVYAITNGVVHPVSGPEISGGVVVIRDGLIESVGAGVAIPADATTIDAKGGHVYPGLVDAQTSAGFASPAPRPRRGEATTTTTERRESAPAINPTPAFIALESLKLSDDDADDWRRIGVTTIVTAPTTDIFNGQSVVLNLGSGEPAGNAIRSPAAMQISFNPRRRSTFPDSLMGVIAYLRQTFLDAQQHSAALAVYQRNPAGLTRPESSRSLDALAPVMRRDLPIVFLADSEEMIRRAQAIAREFNLRYIISGARQGYRMAGDLRDVPVLVSVKWPAPPATKEDREEQPLRVIRDRQLAPTTPSVLAKSGVSFALVSGAGKAGDYFRGIRKAIDNGLSADEALRATTLVPARIFGVDRQLGTLERGKIANVIISDKPIFAKDAKVMRVLVDGREVRLAEKEEAETAAASPAEGTWNLTVRMPSGSVSIVVTLHVENGRVTGNFSGDRGSGDIRDGTFDDSTLEFTISVKSDAEAGDWTFHGTVRDSNITGNVTTNLGTFEFSGSKSR